MSAADKAGARTPTLTGQDPERQRMQLVRTHDRRAEAEAVLASARARIYHDASDAFVFPWASVDRLVGRVRPGSLVILAAATGQGKTTFMLNVLNLLAQGEVPTDFMGTEQEPGQLLTKWAAMRVRVPVNVVERMDWASYPDATAQSRVAEEADFVTAAYMIPGTVHFVPELFITLPAIEHAVRDAQDQGAAVLMIDHIDRVDSGGDRDAFQANQRLVRRLKELARDAGLVIVAASQMNREARGGDRLSVYSPPQLHHMRGGGTKEEEADVVLGLWRPRRGKAEDETPDQFKQLLKAARVGEAEPWRVLEPNTIGVVVLKHRPDGGQEGRETRLRIEGGVISDIAERDKYRTTRYTGAGDPALELNGRRFDYEADERAGMQKEGE